MKVETKIAVPDNTAVRVALQRAMHVQVDALPHVLEDETALQLVAPDESWRQRPGNQPVCDSWCGRFAQRRPELAFQLSIFEVDQPDTLNWKRQRLVELGFGIPNYLVS